MQLKAWYDAEEELGAAVIASLLSAAGRRVRDGSDIAEQMCMVTQMGEVAALHSLFRDPAVTRSRFMKAAFVLLEVATEEVPANER